MRWSTNEMEEKHMKWNWDNVRGAVKISGVYPKTHHI